MQYKISVGSLYTVTAAAEECVVTDAAGRIIATVQPGEQRTFTASTSTVELSDAAAALTALASNFKRAASALGLLGGGVKSELPAGYLRAEFLESTGTQYIDTGEPVQLAQVFEVSMQTTAVDNSVVNYLFGGSAEPNILWAFGEWGSTADEKNWVYTHAGDKHGDVCLYSTLPKFQKMRVKLQRGAVDVQVVGKVLSLELTYSTSSVAGVRSVYLFGVNFPTARLYAGKIYNFKMTNAATDYKLEFVAAICDGVPCMYDRVSGKPFYNGGTGQLIAGFTLPQARKLGKHLPEGGGSLTISLPTGYEQDAAVTESLETARAKGWTLTVQTYTPEAEAAATTFGMRRVWVRRTQDEQGGYVDADGTRCQVDWCVDMVTPDGSTPDQHGYELYRSTEAAVAYWELSAWVDPEEEQEFFTTEEQ